MEGHKSGDRGNRTPIKWLTATRSTFGLCPQIGSAWYAYIVEACEALITDSSDQPLSRVLRVSAGYQLNGKVHICIPQSQTPCGGGTLSERLTAATCALGSSPLLSSLTLQIKYNTLGFVCQGVFWLFFVRSFYFTCIGLCARERLFSLSP